MKGDPLTRLVPFFAAVAASISLACARRKAIPAIPGTVTAMIPHRTAAQAANEVIPRQPRFAVPGLAQVRTVKARDHRRRTEEPALGAPRPIHSRLSRSPPEKP